MEDPVNHEEATDGTPGILGDNPEELERMAEEAMEQMLLAQEQEEAVAVGRDALDDNGDNAFDEQDHDNFEENGFPEDDAVNLALMNGNDNFQHNHHKENPFSYVKASFLAAFVLVFYAFRSRQQWYLALVFLSSSKWAYIILGNALIAFLISIFQLFTGVFMNGLRLAEAEGLGDFFRWNVTETCLALTIFRAELTVKTGILFLMFVLAKCLHWVADMREGHLRMTEEAVVAMPNSSWPSLRWHHVKLLLCLYFLQLIDILAVIQCAQDIFQHGPSVSILFAFEGAIMLTSAVSNVLLWHLHFLDGLFHFVHETTNPTNPMHRWIHPWKDHKATLVFAVEVQAQATKFCFYLTFFAIVMTYYGLPINLIREVYISFNTLKQRLVAFRKYRQLMASMNRFSSPTEEELGEDHTCIICRDEMTLETSKRLPGCGHIMHKSCLREWLVQQQTCPTCRGDISAMEARQRQQDVVDGQNREQAQQELEEEKDESDDSTEPIGENPELQNGVANNESVPELSPDSSLEHRPTPSSNLIDDMDKKKSTALNNRGKRVRIVTPGALAEIQTPLDSSDAFPAFYRVVQDSGAAVYHDGESISFVIRMVPFGVVILGQKMAWRNCDGENQMMVRIPDGWICEEHLERIVAIQLEV
jgi:E3 ubiquitin-protein ligase synoviolin